MVKIAKIPIPSRQNAEVLPLDQVSSEYNRIVFDKAGISYKTDFLSEEEKDQEINDLSYIQANLVYEEKIPETESIANTQANLVFDERFPQAFPLPALYSESSSGNPVDSLNQNFNYFSNLKYNPDSIVTKVSSDRFRLNPGYTYKITTTLTAYSDDEDFSGLEWIVRYTKSSSSGTFTLDAPGCTGIVYREDSSGQVFDDSTISSVDGNHFVYAEPGWTTEVFVPITYVAPGTITTHGDSKILFEVIRSDV